MSIIVLGGESVAIMSVLSCASVFQQTALSLSNLYHSRLSEMRRTQEKSRIRANLRNKHNTLLDFAGPAAIDQSCRSLGLMWKGLLDIRNDVEAVAAFDHCIYDFRIQKLNTVERYRRDNPLEPDSEDAAMLRVMAQAHFSIFEVRECEPGTGVYFYDTLFDNEVFVNDINMSHTAETGLLLATRLLKFPEHNIFTGAALPLDEDILDSAITYSKQASRMKPGCQSDPARMSQLATYVMRLCIREGMAEIVDFR